MKKLLLLITALFILASAEGQILRYSNYTAPAPPASVDLLTGLVSYWGLDESESPAVDLHGDYDGVTWVNTPTPSEASKTGFGTCILFANASQESINTSTAINPGTNDWSISFWFKVNTDSGILNYYIAGKYTTTVLGWYAMVDANMHLNAYLYFSGSAQYCEGTTTLSTGTWYHGVLSVDRDGNATIYLNGEPDGTLDVSDHVAVDVTNGSYSFKIGNRVAGDTWGFDGWIDEVALWYRALTQTEVTALYNSGNGLLYSSFE